MEMLVNNKDIAMFSARLMTFNVSGTAVTNNTSLAGDMVIIPDLYFTTYAPRTLTTTITFFPRMAGSDSRDTSIPERLRRATENMIRFESLILGKTIELYLPDGYYYTAIAQSIPAADFDSTGLHDVTYTFLAIRHLQKRTQNVIPGGKIKCLSNTNTRLVLKATFSQSHENVTIFGVEVSNITSGDVLIIDSERGLITCNGVNKFLDTEFYDFPILTPGENIISCTAADAEIQVTYTPVFA